MAGRMAGPIKTKLGIVTHVDPGSVLVKVKVKVILRHLANANKTPYRGPQGPREFERRTEARRAETIEARRAETTTAGGLVLTASVHCNVQHSQAWVELEAQAVTRWWRNMKEFVKFVNI